MPPMGVSVSWNNSARLASSSAKHLAMIAQLRRPGRPSSAAFQRTTSSARFFAHGHSRRRHRFDRPLPAGGPSTARCIDPCQPRAQRHDAAPFTLGASGGAGAPKTLDLELVAQAKSVVSGGATSARQPNAPGAFLARPRVMTAASGGQVALELSRCVVGRLAPPSEFMCLSDGPCRSCSCQ